MYIRTGDDQALKFGNSASDSLVVPDRPYMSGPPGAFAPAGIGRFEGEVRQGRDGNLYRWVQGYDGLGNPVGFWDYLQDMLRRLRPSGPAPSPPAAASGSQVCFPSGTCLPIVTAYPQGKGEEYWDPNSSGNPLLDTSAAHRGLKLSEHFTVRELASSGGKASDVARIDPKLVECLESIRQAAGKPLTVTSGYRSWGYNKRLYEKRGKKPTLSQHCSGRAADIKIAGLDGYQIGKIAIDVCGCKIGLGFGMGANKNGVHVDVRGEWAKWDYGSAKAADFKRRIIGYRSGRC